MVLDNSLSLKSNEFSVEILSKVSGIEPLNLLPCKFICCKEFPLKQEVGMKSDLEKDYRAS
ncbi:hypothetical protein MANES_02G202527v8 [Manihot esculenta]|uniref:Uncharacterized protein n=1 Tax=Manihot esculenta TaxID=3983 RepID=A0ACB7I976_MANES|nr:hypothetical protein MANES_02G202527v8 [Manihot esculenta]